MGILIATLDDEAQEDLRYNRNLGIYKGALFENMVADYVQETGNHVLYRVTPDFQGSELVARGVQMEGYSIEDNGAGICFNVYAYNIQPGIEIDYLTGDSWRVAA